MTHSKVKEDVLSLIVMICEAFTSSLNILYQNADLLFEQVFPKLLKDLNKETEEVKFNNLKMFSDIYV